MAIKAAGPNASWYTNPWYPGEGSVNSLNLPLLQSNLPPSIIIPPIEVPFPVMYFVVEWITISAPCSIGLIKYGVATVLSTINGSFCFFAVFDISDKSKTSSFGFPIVSA